jgi:predicted metal-dependent peptidase
MGATNSALEACRRGVALATQHPLLAPLADAAHIMMQTDGKGWAADAWLEIGADGVLRLNARRRAGSETWLYVLAHGLLHVGLGHFRPHREPDLWKRAADLVVARFLDDLKIGCPPEDYPRDRLAELGADEAAIVAALRDRPEEAARLVPYSLGGTQPDLVGELAPFRLYGWRARRETPEQLLARGIADAARRALDVAAGRRDSLLGQPLPTGHGAAARRWIIDRYPLLGALAAGFDLVEDPVACRSLAISIAAVDISGRIVYLNPASGLTPDQWIFVLAHELLHAGLRHEIRAGGRDPFLWNCACDFVINDWLIEAGIGDAPPGLLHDLGLRGQSAETVYDRLAKDLRRARKLATLRGAGLGDLLDHAPGHPRGSVDIDAFCRRALAQGLSLHLDQARGYLPAGLVEEIRALARPPVPWDVELGRWLFGVLPPAETRRSYARPSRRQGATPDIPRPRTVPLAVEADERTFAVVLDTSGSMDKALLGKAIGTVAAYAREREVPAVRLVYCDAAPYDEGYVAPDDLLDRVRVKGRGGTVLQAAVDLLEQASDFPKTGPILVITDGACDVLRVRREHAFLVPPGFRLPFTPRGPVFALR